MPLSANDSLHKETFTGCSLLHRLLIIGRGDEVLKRKEDLSPSLLSHTCTFESKHGSYKKVCFDPFSSSDRKSPNHQVTALHLAARFSSASVIKAFVQAGAKVEAQDGEQQTSLHYAARFNTCEDVIRKLIECGADVNVCDENRATPLHRAAWLNSKVVPVLAQLGAKVNILSSSNRSPLSNAAQGSFDFESKKKAVKALLTAGADPNLGEKPPLENDYVSAEMKTLIREHLSL